jgi:hypothetical protein
VDSRQKKDQHLIRNDGVLLSGTMITSIRLLRYVAFAMLVIIPGVGMANSLVETEYTVADKRSVGSPLSSQLLASPAADPSRPASVNELPADSNSVADIILLFGIGLFVLVGIASWAERPRKARAFKRGNKPEQ